MRWLSLIGGRSQARQIGRLLGRWVSDRGVGCRSREMLQVGPVSYVGYVSRPLPEAAEIRQLQYKFCWGRGVLRLIVEPLVESCVGHSLAAGVQFGRVWGRSKGDARVLLYAVRRALRTANGGY